jgi:hypothetical protein
MAHDPVPAPGHDGEPPLPGDSAWDGSDAAGAAGAEMPAAGLPAAASQLPNGADDDFDADADLARWLEEIDSGREPIPSEEELRAPAVMFTLGETADVDPVVLGSMAGPDGLGGQAFDHEQVADAMPPGPLLAALTENATAGLGALPADGLLGVISAARRLANRAEYLELTAIAEFTARRRAQYAASAARKDPRGQREGEFADAELSAQLLISGREAGNRMDQATALVTRLPATFAGLGAGTVDAAKAYSIWFYTRFLSDADAAQADQILAAVAPRIRADSLASKAAALEMKLDPEAAKARKEHARKDGRRVEVRREPSGNMSYGGRELAVEEALAVSAAVDADAAALRRAGMAGSLRDLQVMCFLDRLYGRNPFDRLTPPADPASPGDRGDDPAPFPALINLLVPAGTLLGWSNTPGQAGRWGLLDPDDTRNIVRAASQHGRTRWCVTVVGPDGTAAAHGCSRGPRRWTPARPRTTGPGTTRPPPGPDPYQQAQLADLLRALNITLAPIAKGTCDHRHREDRYRPSRKLGHLIRARTATCPAPGCGAQAWHADLDHTVPWPTGPSDECNISPPCRHHHRIKQGPGWKLEQPEPGVMRWTTPSGRTYTTTPTVYDI